MAHDLLDLPHELVAMAFSFTPYYYPILSTLSRATRIIVHSMPEDLFPRPSPHNGLHLFKWLDDAIEVDNAVFLMWLSEHGKYKLNKLNHSNTVSKAIDRGSLECLGAFISMGCNMQLILLYVADKRLITDVQCSRQLIKFEDAAACRKVSRGDDDNGYIKACVRIIAHCMVIRGNLQRLRVCEKLVQLDYTRLMRLALRYDQQAIVSYIMHSPSSCTAYDFSELLPIACDLGRTAIITELARRAEREQVIVCTYQAIEDKDMDVINELVPALELVSEHKKIRKLLASLSSLTS